MPLQTWRAVSQMLGAKDDSAGRCIGVSKWGGRAEYQTLLHRTLRTLRSGVCQAIGRGFGLRSRVKC